MFIHRVVNVLNESGHGYWLVKNNLITNSVLWWGLGRDRECVKQIFIEICGQKFGLAKQRKIRDYDFVIKGPNCITPSILSVNEYVFFAPIQLRH